MRKVENLSQLRKCQKFNTNRVCRFVLLCYSLDFGLNIFHAELKEILQTGLVIPGITKISCVSAPFIISVKGILKVIVFKQYVLLKNQLNLYQKKLLPKNNVLYILRH